jgi:hypothetical protein
MAKCRASGSGRNGLRDGKAIGGYLTSFVDSLSDDDDHTAAVGSPSTP